MGENSEFQAQFGVKRKEVAATSSATTQFVMKQYPMHQDSDGYQYSIGEFLAPDPSQMNHTEQNLGPNEGSERGSPNPNDGQQGSGGTSMDDLYARVSQLEQDVTEVKVSLARIEGRFDSLDSKISNLDTRFDNVVTWKSAFAGLSVLTLGLLGVIGTVIGVAWWMVQQYLGPLLQASSVG
ncbi:hypothetical protein [Chromohalobacter moromii]|uniref:t-SNARE coiled-coil homology domain-containing protein n=1 Tax=Chromohalobacter moromii TaxID=2860329 RepID=A0A9X3AY85_9GAMM|nr:hypothetical protein [Chromohalobacter moromii]MCT8506171.1 hypothetical protein [Chromohalobacter moromii]